MKTKAKVVLNRSQNKAKQDLKPKIGRPATRSTTKTKLVSWLLKLTIRGEYETKKFEFLTYSIVQALTGCTINVPLLGGEDMSVSIDDIIYPGYEKIIPDQGMPIPRDTKSRGNLCLKFLVEFPKSLSDEQRSEFVSILEDVS